MKTRYAITHVNSTGRRMISMPNEPHHHHDTDEAAEAAMHRFVEANSYTRLTSLFGPNVHTFEIRPVRCFDDGRAVSILLDEYSPELDHFSNEAEKARMAALYQPAVTAGVPTIAPGCRRALIELVSYMDEHGLSKVTEGGADIPVVARARASIMKGDQEKAELKRMKTLNSQLVAGLRGLKAEGEVANELAALVVAAESNPEVAEVADIMEERQALKREVERLKGEVAGAEVRGGGRQ